MTDNWSKRTSGSAESVDSGVDNAKPIIFATAVAGLIGYLITVWTAIDIGSERYARFGVIWAVTYMLIGSIAGVQQEFSRATVNISTRGGSGNGVGSNTAGTVLRVRWPLVLFSGVFFGTVFGLSATLWLNLVVLHANFWILLVFALGVGGYAVSTVLAGALSGLHFWRIVAGMIVLDALLRGLFITIVLLAQLGDDALVWALELPFLLTPLLAWFLVRRQASMAAIDVSIGVLLWNVLRTVFAALATVLLLSGFPALLSIFSGTANQAVFGTVILVATLVRSPIVIPALALQGFFIVHLRHLSIDRVRRWLRLVLVIVMFGVVVLAVLAFFLGPILLDQIFHAKGRVDAWFFVTVVLSAGLTAAMFLIGAAAIATARQGRNLFAWAVAAAATIILLWLPLDLVLKTSLALVVAPALGLLCFTRLFWNEPAI